MLHVRVCTVALRVHILAESYLIDLVIMEGRLFWVGLHVDLQPLQAVLLSGRALPHQQVQQLQIQHTLQTCNTTKEGPFYLLFLLACAFTVPIAFSDCQQFNAVRYLQRTRATRQVVFVPS
jgi:hypothetical protein